MANLSNEIVAFAAGNTDFFVAFQDYYFNYQDVCHGRKLGGYDSSVSLEQKEDKVSKCFFAEVEKRSGVARDGVNPESWAGHPNVKWAAMSVLEATVNSILPATVNPSIGLYTDIRYVSYGDIVKFKVKPRTLYTLSQGAHGERSTFRQRQFDGDVTIAPREHLITVYTDMYRVLAGKENLAEFIRMVALSIETEMTKEAALAMTTGMAQGTYPAALSFSGAFDSQRLITLAETVQAYNYNVRPIIAGTATALAKVLPDPSLGFRGTYGADGATIGLIKDFYGFDLMRLPQVATGVNFGLAIDPNTLYILTPALDKLVKGVVSNSLTNSNQYYENADLTQNFTMRKDFNFEFVSAGWGGMYKITD